MKILQICNKPPFPPKDGGCIAMNNLTEGLIAQGNKVKVLTVNTKKHFIDVNDLPVDYRESTGIETVFIDTEVKITDAFINLFSSQSYNIQRFYSPEMEKKLIEVLQSEQYDIVQLESLFVAVYVDTIRKYSKAKIVLRSHNVEYLIWERLAESTANPAKKWYLKLLAKRLKQYELSMLNKYDAIAYITDMDAAIYKKAGCTKPVTIVPFAVNLTDYKEDKSSAEFPGVFHLGAMDWLPNSEGIKWFLDNVWELIQKQNPEVKLYLAGRNMPEWMKNISLKNVENLGAIGNAHAFINSKSIMIVPLLSGGGMRVKIIEGMALGKTIISTSIGAEGIACEDGKNILIADTPQAFANAVIKCIGDKVFSDSIGIQARLLIEKKYDNNEICKSLTTFYTQLN